MRLSDLGRHLEPQGRSFAIDGPVDLEGVDVVLVGGVDGAGGGEEGEADLREVADVVGAAEAREGIEQDREGEGEGDDLEREVEVVAEGWVGGLSLGELAESDDGRRGLGREDGRELRRRRRCGEKGAKEGGRREGDEAVSREEEGGAEGGGRA